MKQIKFLENISLEGKPIWYKGCIYEVMGEFSSQGKNMYKLICEDLQPRGIDKTLEGKFFITINIEDKKEIKQIEKKEVVKDSIKKTTTKRKTTKK